MAMMSGWATFVLLIICYLTNLRAVDTAAWYEYSGSCYAMPGTQNITYNTSVTECTSLGAYPLELDSTGELNFIRTLVDGTQESFWVGLLYDNATGIFLWVRSQTEPTTAMWMTGEPNLTGFCVRLTTQALLLYPPVNPGNVYLLADNPCSSPYMSLCEKAADMKRPVYYRKTNQSTTYTCLLKTLLTDDRLECASICSMMKDCLGFQYTKSLLQCVLYKFDVSCTTSSKSTYIELYTMAKPRC